MRHPEHVARLLREKPAWKEPAEYGSRDHAALGFEDACIALAGSSPLAAAAFLWVHNGDASSRQQLAPHLLDHLARFSLPDSLDPGELVALALDEQHAPGTQRKDALRALVLGVSVEDWDRHWKRPHARLLSEIDSLAGDAWRVARDRLSA